MPLNVNDLVTRKDYFVCKPSVVLRADQTGKGKINQLLLSDWLRFLGDHHLHTWTTRSGRHRSTTYAKVKCRGDVGWLPLEAFDEERGLEVNFVDVGQGDGCHVVTPNDQVLLIDAGMSDNMHRFLSWRYNLRSRNVQRAPDHDASRDDREPWKIDHVVVSHPDEDHYGGLKPVFEDPKLSFDQVYHNGIVERPAEDPVDGVSKPFDLGGESEANGENTCTTMSPAPAPTRRWSTSFRTPPSA